MLKKLLKQEMGQALVVAAAFMVVALGFAALVIDGGNLYLTKAQCVNTADAAALAGSQQLPDNPTQARTDANTYATTNGKSGDTITVTIPTDNKSISVAVNRTVNMFFAKIIGVSTRTVSANATASVGVAASVPWIVPFVISKPPAFNYNAVYVMRMYGAGDFIDYPSTGYPPDTKDRKGNITYHYDYPNDYKTDSVYKNYPLSNRYPYEFDYMNVYITQNASFQDYINWLQNGYHQTFSLSQKMYYYAPSSGGQESVQAFSDRLTRDSNTDYTKAKIGDARVILIPIVNSMLSRNTNTSGNVSLTIIGFTGFFIQEVHQNSYGESFWFEGRFLQDLNIGSGEVTYDPNADFGLRVVKLTQ